MPKPIINTTQRTQKFLDLPSFETQVYIQFGKAKLNKVRPRIVVNTLRGLKNTRNKIRQQKLLYEAGIRIPVFFGEDYQSASQFIDEGGMVVAKRHNHSKGRGMKKFNNTDEFIQFAERHIGRYYYQSFHNMNREWRIHVSRFQDEPVVAYRKCFKQEIVEAYRNEEIVKPWFRNLENCYFKLDGVEEDKSPWFNLMVDECRRAIDVLGMDIAGVDIGENNKVDGGDFVIYEVNSACGMEEHTRSQYESAIETIVESKAERRRLSL